MRNLRTAPTVEWELDMGPTAPRKRRSAKDRGADLLKEAEVLTAAADDLYSEIRRFHEIFEVDSGVDVAPLMALHDQRDAILKKVESVVEKAGKIKGRAAYTAGRRHGLEYPRLWQFFGKYSTTIEYVIEVLEAAGVPISKNEDTGRKYIPYDGAWGITIGGLREFWMSVGCCPDRAEQLAPVYAQTVVRLAPVNSYQSGVHWADAMHQVARGIRATGAQDWATQARGMARCMGQLRSRRWLRFLGKVSPELAQATLSCIPRDADGHNLFPPKWGDLDFWRQVQSCTALTRGLLHRPGRVKAVRLASSWSMAGFTRLPRDPAVLAAGAPNADRLFVNWKRVLPFIQQAVRAEAVSEHLILACLKACEVFGERAAGWLGSDLAEWHDRGIELNKLSETAAEWLYARRKAPVDVIRRAVKLAALEECIRKHFGKELSELTIGEADSLVTSLTFSGVRDLDFALEAAAHKVSQEDFLRWQDRWLARSVPYEAVPWVDIEVDGYRFTRLDRNDPRTLFAGEHTDCCQHPGSAGASCAWHAVESPDGAVVVVERYGKIVAQSWTWRSGDTLVLDNIELLSNKYESGVWAAYEAGCREMLGKLGVQAVHVGTAYNDMDAVGKLEPASALPAPAAYTDANKQRLMCSI